MPALIDGSNVPPSCVLANSIRSSIFYTTFIMVNSETVLEDNEIVDMYISDGRRGVRVFV